MPTADEMTTSIATCAVEVETWTPQQLAAWIELNYPGNFVVAAAARRLRALEAKLEEIRMREEDAAYEYRTRD